MDVPEDEQVTCHQWLLAFMQKTTKLHAGTTRTTLLSRSMSDLLQTPFADQAYHKADRESQ